MHCPLCQHNYTFLECARIVNPFRHACPGCQAPLSFGRQGYRYILTAIAGGGAVAALAIYLEQARGLTPGAALIAFVVTFALATGVGEWVCWKHGVLTPAQGK